LKAFLFYFVFACYRHEAYIHNKHKSPSLVAAFCLHGIFADVQMQVPLRFVTKSSFVTNAGDAPSSFIAYTDCDKAAGTTVDICAELPNNWDWNPFDGVIYMHVYNNPSMVLFST